MRLFTGVWPDEKLAAAVRDYKRTLARRLDGVKWVAEGNEHFTLRFLGETPRERAGAVESAVARGAAKVEPFTAEAGGVVLFPSPRKVRVIALGLVSGGERMRELFDAVEEELAREGYEREGRPFKAHLTLGRLKRPARGIDLPAPGDEFGEMVVDEVRLVESVLSNKGPSYASLARVRLGREG